MDIASLLEVEVKEGKPSELHSNGEIADYKNIPDFSIRVSAVRDVVAYKPKLPTAISHDERHYYKLMFGSDIASVRFRKLHCTACDIHIGSAPAEAHNMHEHPILHVLLCTNCRNFYGDGTFEQGDDATDMFCRWCANGGNLYCCSYCSNTFCYACIKRNFDPLVRKKIERDEKWKCFVCNPADLYSARASCWALLQHVQTVTRILQTDRKMTPEEIETKMNLDESQCCPHKSKRKRSDTPTDDEEEDETYTVPKRKRRKIMNAKRNKRRFIKLEIADTSTDGSPADLENPREPNSNNVSVLSTGSQSESPLGNDQYPEDLPLASRQTAGRRLRSRSSNRSTDADRTKFSLNDDDIPPPLLQCDQSMIEGAESLSFGAPSPETRTAGSSVSRVGITPVPTANLLKRPVAAGPATRGGRDHRFVRGKPLFVRKLSPHLPPPPPTVSQPGSNPKPAGVLQAAPMVSIPSRNHMTQPPANRINVIQPPLQATGLVRNAAGGLLRQIRPRIVLAKRIPNPNTVNKNASNQQQQPPSVIDLESDEDEAVLVVEPSKESTAQQSNDRVPELSTTTYPVRPDDGLMTILSPTPRNETERSGGEEEEEEEAEKEEESGRAKESGKSFEMTLRGPTKSIDAVLDTLKSKLKKVLESAMIFSPDQQLIAAKAKTRAVNRTIKRTVAELTSLSDNLISAYRTYKRECNKDNVEHTPKMTLEKKQRSNMFTSLDMKCTRESEPESDESTSDEDSENSQDIRPVREIRAFRRRVHRAMEAKPETEEKSVQVYDDLVSRDYDKSVGYALLLKADYDAKRERDILRPVMVPNAHFGKYEEEFINYLQYIEDCRNVDNDAEENDDANAQVLSVNDLIEADILAASGGTTDKTKSSSGTSTTSVNNAEDDKRKISDENIEIFDEHLEISITTVATHSSSSDSDSSSSSDSEVSEPRTNREKASEDKTAEDEKSEKESTEKKEKPREIEESTASTEKTEKGIEVSSENKKPKVRSRATDEETVLAVRALIEEDSSENSNSNTPLNSWKPVESDDECTVLD